MSASRRPQVVVILTILFQGYACTGVIGTGDPAESGGPGGRPVGGGSETLSCSASSPPRLGASPLRRLTRFEYDNTVRDLLGTERALGQGFASDGEAFGFDNNADLQRASRLLIDQYAAAAEILAQEAADDLDPLLPCDPEEIGEARCAEAFIDVFGARAFRRPLSDEERTRFRMLYVTVANEYDFRTGVRLVIEAMLQSSSFLYRVELAGEERAEEVVPLDPWELASRLSYLFWGSMPDDALFAAAASGGLATTEDIEREARRMLDDPRANATLERFHAQWLNLAAVDRLTKDEAIYPEFGISLRGPMREETERFIRHVLFEGDGTLTELLLAPYTFVNGALSSFYHDVPAPSTGGDFAQVSLVDTRRRGFLTQASFLATRGKFNQSDPIHRGLFVRERMLCQSLPPPPPNVEITPPDLDPNLTTRERFRQHAEDPACEGCHRLVDPIGLGFENFDGVGRYREEENGRAVDASGAIVLGSSSLPFDGPIELAERLASAPEVSSCVVRLWFRFGYGRNEGALDACTLATLERVFEASGTNIRELFLALTLTDAFRYRRRSSASEAM